MGSSTQMDLGGLTIVCDGINVGATKPGQTGTALASAELSFLDGAVAANTGTNKAVITGTSGALALGGEMTLAAGTTINLDSSTATLSSHAATITKYACQVTTEALTTAAAASQAFVLTLTGAAATDLAFCQLCGGTNTQGTPILNAVMTSNTCTVTVKNHHASEALNGTLKFNVWILKA